MNVNLTKEEWEFLNHSAKQYRDIYKGNMELFADILLYRMAEQFLEKLGTEWVDDDK